MELSESFAKTSVSVYGDRNNRDVAVGTRAYRVHCFRHLGQHLSYFLFGYDADSESRPRIEKSDFILAARDARLARESVFVSNHGEMYDDGLPVAEAVVKFDPEIKRPKSVNCGLGDIVEDKFEGAVRERMAKEGAKENITSQPEW